MQFIRRRPFKNLVYLSKIQTLRKETARLDIFIVFRKQPIYFFKRLHRDK